MNPVKKKIITFACLLVFGGILLMGMRHVKLEAPANVSCPEGVVCAQPSRQICTPYFCIEGRSLTDEQFTTYKSFALAVIAIFEAVVLVQGIHFVTSIKKDTQKS